MDLNKLLKATNKNVDLFSLNNKEIIAKIVSVYDADTCKAVFYLDNKLTKFTIRLVGINTPEMRPSKKLPNRNALKKFAMKARNRLVQLSTDCTCNLDTNYTRQELKAMFISNERLVKIKCGEFDKHGNLLVELYDINGDISYNQTLIDENYSVPYDEDISDFKFNNEIIIDDNTIVNTE